jgi:hypothetical protein
MIISLQLALIPLWGRRKKKEGRRKREEGSMKGKKQSP